MEKERRSILHVDMDSFFASCEQAVNEELRRKPLIVGGDPKRRSGIVLAASYDAKKFGVKTTMSIYEAMKKCPDANIITPSHGLYERMSKGVMRILGDFTPLVEQISIDEAYLEVKGTESLFGDSLQIAKLIQQRILSEMNLSCSIGISSNKLLAKMASDYRKPFGITVIDEEDVEKMLWHMPVGELYGVGKRSVPKLRAIGIHTIGDLAKADMSILESYFGVAMAQMFVKHANGIDDSTVNAEEDELKSVGNETTLTKDLTDHVEIQQVFLSLCDKVAFRLRKKMLKGRTISIKLKFSDFTVITRSKTIDNPTDSTDVIYKVVKDLFLLHHMGRPIRLIGVTVSHFTLEEVTQLSLFNGTNDTEKTDKMVDEIRSKFGYGAIKRAGSSLEE